MPIHKSLRLAVVLCAIAIAAALAVVARGASGPSAINDASTNVQAATVTGFAPANTGGGECLTGPGQKCAVDWLMSKGTATATAYGVTVDGVPVIGNPVNETCSSSTCEKRAVATPSPNVIVEEWVVTGPNISVICTGPTWLC